MPILITGCARSGTSLTASIFKAHDLDLGTVNGLFENTSIREHLLKPMIERAGGDRLGQSRLPSIGVNPPVSSLRARVEKHFTGPWAYKDAMLSLVWRTWADAFPEAKWVIVRRSVESIAKSCMYTPFMRAYQTESEWHDWALACIWRLQDLRCSMKCPEIDMDQVMRGNFESMRKAFEYCEIEFEQPLAESLLDPTKWRH